MCASHMAGVGVGKWQPVAEAEKPTGIRKNGANESAYIAHHSLSLALSFSRNSTRNANQPISNPTKIGILCGCYHVCAFPYLFVALCSKTYREREPEKSAAAAHDKGKQQRETRNQTGHSGRTLANEFGVYLEACVFSILYATNAHIRQCFIHYFSSTFFLSFHFPFWCIVIFLIVKQ